ncbi:MAG: CoA transferase, partial [Actinomycetota bacterium]
HGSSAVPEPKLDSAGHRRILTPHRRPQPTQDGLVHLMPYSGEHYRKLFVEAGRPEFADDRLSDRATRYANSDGLYRDLAIASTERRTDEWLAFCETEGIPCTAVATLDELVDELPLDEHPLFGTHRVIPHPVRYGETPASIHRPAPALGEHGRELLTEVGYDRATIDRLATDGTLVLPEA